MKQLLARLAFLASILAASGAWAEQAKDDNPLAESATWNDLRGDIAGDAALADGAPLFTVTAPYRANDAATVPIVIEQTDANAGRIETIKLVIDENPAPVAADIRFGPAMHPLKFETRVRVNQYSNVRVIAETANKSFMNGRYVKASGGCSAPATKDPEAALAGMGEMRLRLFDGSSRRGEAQIMIRHPNYSGLQRDQITQLFINAHFINEIEVYQGDELLFALEGGISISENPVFRFEYDDNGAPAFRIRAVDTEENVFEQTLPKTPPA
ncbi:quinoprotein dehydrogenase-associated SoxYZ-like carrier [Notoacmeibacter sp. MSK16QG-6]|uniref:quinoprotein dehydrogenase-associated SoxYZ-like carrier n=1 Tax=Notoacmeibacter sp. MSK16QG-6 TaxID=2957982 RepID=UPI0020A10332|nr:quinoprotein dehydrogenase-associated SoxYZ-like carrier [Notoacmeibacter sp. MSK16QG-6]MCP1200641.1 quinoprotein dehydrogenase-associated SoxYZ-like carrier [Notoacmeibacter sp. MSK16QG-6]